MAPHVVENADGTVSHRCPFCGGCSHPATGHAYAPGYVACWRCTLEAFSWAARWTNRRPVKGRPAFYNHARFEPKKEHDHG